MKKSNKPPNKNLNKPPKKMSKPTVDSGTSTRMKASTTKVPKPKNTPPEAI